MGGAKVKFDVNVNVTVKFVDTGMSQTDKLLALIYRHVMELKQMSTTEKQVLADLQTEVQANTTVVGSVQALVQNLATQLAAAIQAAQNAGVSTEDLAAFQAVHDSLAANDTALANLVIANTPAAQATGS
jgi:hypothetical protein